VGIEAANLGISGGFSETLESDRLGTTVEVVTVEVVMVKPPLSWCLDRGDVVVVG
jgi:hypothetical protein